MLILGSENQSLAPSDSVWESEVKVGSLGVDFRTLRFDFRNLRFGFWPTGVNLQHLRVNFGSLCV